MYLLSDKRPGDHPEPISAADSLILRLSDAVLDHHLGSNTLRPFDVTYDRDEELIADVKEYFHLQKLLVQLNPRGGVERWRAKMTYRERLARVLKAYDEFMLSDMDTYITNPAWLVLVDEMYKVRVNLSGYLIKEGDA